MDNGGPFRLTNSNDDAVFFSTLHLSGLMIIFIQLNPGSPSALLAGTRLRILMIVGPVVRYYTRVLFIISEALKHSPWVKRELLFDANPLHNVHLRPQASFLD